MQLEYSSCYVVIATMVFLAQMAAVLGELDHIIIMVRPLSSPIPSIPRKLLLHLLRFRDTHDVCHHFLLPLVVWLRITSELWSLPSGAEC